MRALPFLLSLFLLIAACALAAHIGHLRYGGAAARSLALALIVLTIACPFIALIAGRIDVSRPVKIAAYFISGALLAAALTLHQIGMDGIWPRTNGTQTVGAQALVTNADLFLLIMVVAAFACRRAFRKA